MGKGETLKDYQGWVTRPENDTVLTELIRTWIRDSSQNEAAMLVAEPVSKLQRMGIQLLKQSSEQYYLQGPMIAVGAASDEATVEINKVVGEMGAWATQPDEEVPKIAVPTHIACVVGLHSFRRGGASWAYRQGVPVDTIRQLGDWASNAYTAYVLDDTASLSKALRAVTTDLPSQ